MFGIGFPELILILALALIVVGPDKLPDLARSIAKTLVDLKKTAEGFKESLNENNNPLSEIKPELEDAAKKFKETVLDAETKTWDNRGTPTDLDKLDSATKELLDQTIVNEEELLSSSGEQDISEKDQSPQDDTPPDQSPPPKQSS